MFVPERKINKKERFVSQFHSLQFIDTFSFFQLTVLVLRHSAVFHLPEHKGMNAAVFLPQQHNIPIMCQHLKLTDFISSTDPF